MEDYVAIKGVRKNLWPYLERSPGNSGILLRKKKLKQNNFYGVQSFV